MRLIALSALGLVVLLLAPCVAQADEPAEVAAWVKKNGGQFTHHTSNDGGPGYEILLSNSTTDADLKAFLALKPTKLWDLNLGPCRKLSADAVKELRDLPALRALRVPVATTDDGVKYIVSALPKLETLILQETKVTNASLPTLAALKKLTNLYLVATPVTDDCWKVLAAFPALVKVSLSYTSVKGEGIKQLAAIQSLRELDLQNTAVTDSAIDELAKLTTLETLSVGNTKLTDAGIKKLQQSLPKCRVVK